MPSIPLRLPTDHSPRPWITALLLLIVAVSLTGCGSTKVYTADKTVVYRDSIYNVSNVKVFSPKNEGDVGQAQPVDLSSMDKKQFESLLKEHPSIQVTQGFMMDDQELVYQRQQVTSWSQFNKMTGKFQSANKSLTKFLADKKKTQLKLK
jgi:hypothetical protein